MIKVAQYAAQLEDYDKAIQIYEQVSRTGTGSRHANAWIVWTIA